MAKKKTNRNALKCDSKQINTMVCSMFTLITDRFEYKCATHGMFVANKQGKRKYIERQTRTQHQP